MIMPEQNLGLELLDMLLIKWQPFLSHIPKTVKFKCYPARFWFYSSLLAVFSLCLTGFQQFPGFSLSWHLASPLLLLRAWHLHIFSLPSKPVSSRRQSGNVLGLPLRFMPLSPQRHVRCVWLIDMHNTGGHKKNQCPQVSREPLQSWPEEESFWEMRFIYHSGLPLGSFTQQHRCSCIETYWGSWDPSSEQTRWLGGLPSREFFAKKGLWFKSIWNT